MILRLSKLAALTEKELTEEDGLGPGVPKRTTTPLPTVKKPEIWEFSGHPHFALRAGKHVDIRLGNPATGIAHSFVLPRRTELPGPGQSALVVPTFDHTIEYMDYTGPISSTYGKGEVVKGRREKTEVYHADSSDEPGTKARFNLYEGPHPEEFSIRKDQSGKWFIHNKTQTRERRPDIPAGKPKYKEIDVDQINPGDNRQAMMPKLDGAHAVIDLKAGRAPRVFSYREAKKSGTGFIEHTHKMPEMLTKKVPASLDRTILRGEVLGLKDGQAIPAQKIGGLLNSRVWKSREEQELTGVQLKTFPFDVVLYKGKSMEGAPFSEKLKVLREVEKSLAALEVPPLATNAEEKISLMNTMKAGKHPLTEEGFVLVDKNHAAAPIKAKFVKDYDVFVRGVSPAKKKGGGFHDRAGNVSYSWTPDGPIAGTIGGFAHDEAKDMLANPDKYVGRVAKAKAPKVFTDKEGNPTAMFQGRFKEWHLDKGDIEKIAKLNANVVLRPHQEESVQFVLDNDGRGLMAHGTGTGKTLSSLAAVERLRDEGKVQKTLVVAPASLRRNFSEQGVQKFTDRSVGPIGSGADYQVMSLEKFRKDPKGALEDSGANTLIIDEIHRAKDPSTQSYKALKEISQGIDNLIGLTGSFISNHPKELVPLMDIVDPSHELGNQQKFTESYTKRKKVGGGGFLKLDPRYRTVLKKTPQLHQKIKGRLHYVGHDELSDLPKIQVKDVHVPMTQEQTDLYNFAFGKLSPSHRRKIRKGLPVSQSEASWILPQIMKARQASNSVGTHQSMSLVQAAESTPKLRKVMDDVQEHLRKTPDGQALIYTNLLNGGARELIEGLKERGMQVGMYSGINPKTRDQDVSDFQEGKKRALVLTPAGGEGISLNNATFFAEVDRHYNPERNQQALARGRRLGGLEHRAPEKRVLEVNRYYSDPRPNLIKRMLGVKDVGVDEWIGMVAREKDILNEEMRGVARGAMKKTAQMGAFLNELEKIAIDPLTIAGVGAASHVGANIITKLLHGKLSPLRAQRLAAGVREGLKGTQRGVKSRALELWAGPEHTSIEHAGRFLGSKLRELPTGQRYRVLKKLRKAIASTPELHKTPIFEDVVPGLNKALSSSLPSPMPIQTGGEAARNIAAAAAPAAILAAVEPGALIHGGVNILRKRVATSSPGKKFLRESFLKGIKETPQVSELISSVGGKRVSPVGKLKELATDVLVSPQALESRRIGRSLASLGVEPGGGRKLIKIYGAISPLLKK